MSANARLLIILDAQDKTRGAFSGVENALKGLDSGSKSAGQALGSMAADIAKAGAVVGGVLVTGIGAAIGQATGFEKSLSAVGAASQASATEMQGLHDKALQLGASTELAGINATDAARAMTELAKGGVSVADIMGGAANGALLLASAGEIAVGDAAGIAVKAMTIFHQTGQDIAHDADLIAAAAGKSATDVSSLAAAFNQSASVAANAGLSIEELTGTLGFLAQRGLEGSDAGTSLKTALQRLQAPTDDAAKAMEALGINVRDSQGRMLPFAQVADILHDRLSGLSDAQRDAALQTIFGADAIRVAIPLVQEGGNAVRDWTAKVNDAGYAARQGAALNNNLAGSWDQFQATVQTAAIGIGEKFIPVLRKGSDELAKFVDSLASNKDVAAFFDDLAKKASTGLDTIINKLKDPAFQRELKEWGQTALDAGKAIASLAGDVAEKLGPPLKAAADWFGSLDDQGRKNVVMFGLVAGAAIKFRDELGTLKGVVEDVIGAFARKATAKAALQKANEGLAGSAGKTATAMAGTGVSATATALAIADLAAVTVANGAAAGVLITGYGALADQMDQSGQRAKDNTQAWDAAAFAIEHGGTQANGVVDAFTRLVVATGEQNISVARGSVLWNQYVASLQAGGQSTDTLGLSMVNLAQFITGQVAPAFESAANSGVSFNNTLSGLGVGAKTLAESMTAVAPGVSAADQALGAVVISSQNVGIGMGTAAQSMAAVNTAAANMGGYSAVASAALNDLNTFGNSAAEGLNAAANAAMAAGLALADTDRTIQGLGTTAGTLQGYLRPLQAQWDELNKVTNNGTNVTAAQQAEFERLAPAIMYLNGQIGVNKSQTVDATLAAIENYKRVQDSGNAYLAAGLAAGVSAGNLAVSTAAANVAAGAHSNLTDKVKSVPTTVNTTASTNAPKIAGEVAGLQLAIALVPKEFTVTAYVNIGPALAAIATLNNNMPHSPAKEGPFSTLPNWDALFESFPGAVQGAVGQFQKFGAGVKQALSSLSLGNIAQDIGGGSDGSIAGIMRLFAANFAVALDTMKATAGAAGDFLTEAQSYKSMILLAVTAIKEAQAALNTVNFGGGSLPSPQAAGQGLGDGITKGIKKSLDIHSPSQVMAAIGRDVVAGLVEGMDAAQQDAAKKAADVASAIADAVSKGVAAFTSLGSFVAPGAGSIAAFGQTVRLAVNDLAVLSAEVGSEMLAAAATFAEGAVKALGLYGSGLSGFAGLRDYVRPAASAIYDFGKDLRLALNDLAVLAEQLTTDTSDLAGKFGEGVAKAVSGLANAVAGFAALRDYARIPSDALYAFGKDLRLLVQDFAAIVDLIGVEMVEQAGNLGESVGKVTGGIAGAVAGFAALRDFARVPAADIAAFADTLGDVLARMVAVGRSFEQQGLDAAVTLGESIGKVLGGVGTAVSGIKALFDFAAPPASALDAFAASVRDMIARMAQIAGTLSIDGTTAAAALGEGFAKVFGGLSQATSFFKSLDGLLLPDQGGIDRILAPLLTTVRAVADAARTIDPGTLAAAVGLADAFGAIAGNIQAGNNALGGAGGGGGASSGRGNTYQIIFSGNVYGSADFDQRILQAKSALERQGAWG